MQLTAFRIFESVHIKHIYRQLDDLVKTAVKLPFEKKDKWVVFSDLHIGDRTRKDDFKRNSGLFKAALSHYNKGGFKLFLNGDIEELQRFSYETIRKKWHDVFDLFQKFNEREALFKTFGNHDLEFGFNEEINREFPARDAYILQHSRGDIFLFHGHQASPFYFKYNRLVGWLLKYVANPLRINNYSVAHNSRKQYQIEKRVYHYSAFKQMVSVIGHTHRPLFESLSKADRLKMQIETLCRRYVKETDEDQMKEIKKTIKSHKKELKKIFRKKKHLEQEAHLYNAILHIPCLFNSGTAIGKRGITCLEIENNQIRLVHWFDEHLSGRYLNKRGYDPELVDRQGHYRMVLNEESLDYIFARIKLLG